MNFTDLHTDEHRLQPAGDKIICLDCQHIRKMEEVDNAIVECLHNGISIPNMETDEEKESWFDKFMAEGKAFGEEL